MSYDISTSLPTSLGKSCRAVSINKEDLSLKESTSEIIPCYVYTETLNNYQSAPITIEEVKQKVLDFMNGKLDNPY